jgi:D-amino-acid dehydrogenase
METLLHVFFINEGTTGDTVPYHAADVSGDIRRRQGIGSGRRWRRSRTDAEQGGLMKVLVMGAGVIGVTSAYYLAKAGFEVTVVDRQAGVALETSFANAGEISPGYASPWAGPGVPLKAIQWMLDKHGPLVVHPQFDPLMWRWVLQMLRNCTANRYAINKSRMVPIAEYSRDCLRALRAETGISYDHRSQGTLQLFRKQSQLDSIDKDVAVLRQYGVKFEVLDREGCMRAEPGLATALVSFAGGLRLPEDETGDCYLFTQRLMTMAEAAGVRFLSNTRIDNIGIENDRITTVATDSGPMVADVYIMALGSFSSLMLRPIGIDIPVYPVKGYSITVPVAEEEGAPQSTVMDEIYKVAITRLGNRIRVGGTAELGGYQIKLAAGRRVTLERSLMDLFPRGGDLKGLSFWSGLRPMTPDGPPIIGQTRYRNLYLNTGHGTLGWTMACGAARILADCLLERKPEVPIDALSLARYRAN